jgi:hypothetical protein
VLNEPTAPDAELLTSGAEFSDDRVYRFRLWRRWELGPMLMVVGLNPSTADETEDDPTVRRCIGYARSWGFAGLMMLNAFAFRATNPREMKAAPDLVWSENLGKIESAARITTTEGGAVLAAWGNDGDHRHRSSDLRWVLSKGTQKSAWHPGGVACLGLTKSGQPKHPLYLGADTKPVRFIGDGGPLVRTP